MIIFVATAEHKYTHTRLCTEPGVPPVEVMSYAELLSAKRLKRATYVLMDFDRLSAARLRDVALFYRRLRDLGLQVLNDPAKFRSRYGLLRCLKRLGLNDFNAYRAEEMLVPNRWPVFLRTEGNHAYPVSALLDDAAAMKEAVKSAVAAGYPYSSMLIVEYCAEPVRPGLFRRFSVLRVGERMLGYTCAHDDKWVVKYGQPGIAPPELYEEEFEIVMTNPFGEQMRRVFELGGVEYGRVDFGMVGGRPQVFEINTNPNILLTPPPSPAPRRNESVALFKTNYIAALKALEDRAPRFVAVNRAMRAAAPAEPSVDKAS
jgi:hypothetical protein